MTDNTINLDRHRGMAAQKATDLRRLLADVEADQRALRRRQDELEAHLLAAPAADWREAAEKARYLLNRFGAALTSQDPRRQKLIAAVLADFERLLGESYVASLRCGTGTMTLNFTNQSRSYDATLRAVRFWGHDGVMEASFYVNEDALKRIQPSMRPDKAGILAAFDSHRDLIHMTAAKVYRRGRKGSYELIPTDF